ncbi:metallophosphoesterase [Allobranchiibius sp. GilTou73]|uniref:metallophosphoesterase n=1 Tax=Allobranchiibius sp. GilTou73 TaxID=2904523 RepID=UPI001F48041D|nr:metallophosphoesterase [Allobranchiibius sp. GilTou73]UIJ35119.1 metallophosphoesterase [Allobranchiibius sp. GilTou73]
MHPAARAAAAVTAAGAGALAWASLVERNWYAVRRATLPVLPDGATPVRVLHISDLHLVPRQERRIAWVRGLASLEPDFVVNTGDNCSDLDAVPAVLRAMEPLLHLPGAFVLGSNDYFAPTAKNPLLYFNRSHPRGSESQADELPWRELVAGFTSGGWLDLTNARRSLTVRGLDLELVGVDDPHLGYDRYPAVAGPADPAADLTMGVLHAPYTHVLDAMAADGARVLLAGHTHGGQLCVPGYGALVTNCDLDRRRAKGVSRWWPGANGQRSTSAPCDAAWLEVSAGLGHNKYTPVRFACRPEATLLTLAPASWDSGRTL